MYKYPKMEKMSDRSEYMKKYNEQYYEAHCKELRGYAAKWRIR